MTEIACERCLTEADITQFETASGQHGCERARRNGRRRGAHRSGRERRLDDAQDPGPQGGAGEFVAVSLTDTGLESRRRNSPRSSSRSSRPKKSARAPGSACRRSTDSPSKPAETSMWRASSGGVQPLPSTCPTSREASSTPTSARQMQRDTGGGRRVLVVEDNREVGEFSSQLLHDLGYETTWAANAGEALDVLRTASRSTSYSPTWSCPG